MVRAFPVRQVEFQIFRKLNSPAKIQDFLNSFGMNFEKDGEVCRSPLEVLKKREAHCLEGAILAAAIFWHHGHRPLLLDLKTIDPDVDHVVALFKEGDRWGAVSKTNHAVLRYRESVYKTVRELALSYFHEYFLDNGKKTLRSYSRPFSLLAYDDIWLTSKDNLWAISDDLDRSPHTQILKKGQVNRLRPADKVEIRAGQLTEWTRKNTRKIF